MTIFRHKHINTADHDLVKLVAGGDASAFEELVKRHENAILNLAFRFLGDPAEAKDIAQESFIRICQNAASYKPTFQSEIKVDAVNRLNSIADGKIFFDFADYRSL